MPFTDNPIRHIANDDGTTCQRCGTRFQDGVHKQPGDAMCQKTDGWFDGDLAWAKDCIRQGGTS
jgi:hypothetical protein